MFKIQTILGPIYLTPTEANHIYVDLWQENTCLVVRGVEIGGSIHMYRWADGSWKHGPEFLEGHQNPTNAYEQRQAVYLKRKDWLSRGNRDDTPSDWAWKLIVATVTTEVNAWAKANEPVLWQAQVDSLESAISNQKPKIAEAEKALAFEQGRLRQLQEKWSECIARLQRLETI
jgi:hypothetical protein